MVKILKIIPHGGVNEIGGNTFLVETNSTRILLDFGRSFKQEGTYFEGYLLPRTFQGLKDLLEFNILPKIQGLYAQEYAMDFESPEDTIDACLLSHAHLDHFGNLNLIDNNIPIYLGETTATIIQSIQDTTRTRFSRPYLRQATAENPSNFRTFRTGDVIQIRELEIIPIHVDHSLPGSYGFVIEGEKEKKIGYTGDLRLHGWREDLTRDFIDIAKKRNLDVLLIEGTNVNEDFNMNERRVQQDISEAIARTESLAIANYSLRDIDRFRSFYLSARINGRKLLINAKQAYLLQLLQDDPNLEIPPLDDPFIEIYKRPKKKYYKWETQLFENYPIVKSSDFDQTEYIFHCEFWNLTDLIDIQPHPKKSTYFYSHGEPFDEEGAIDFRRLQEWIDHFQLDFKQYHASGHAPRSDLKSIIEKIQPQLVIPIHTEHPETFQEIVDIPVLLAARGREISV